MNLEPNVDLTEIAAKSEGFTGADLQAILYSAQLNAVQEERSCMNGPCCLHQFCYISDMYVFILHVVQFSTTKLTPFLFSVSDESHHNREQVCFTLVSFFYLIYLSSLE